MRINKLTKSKSMTNQQNQSPRPAAATNDRSKPHNQASNSGGAEPFQFMTRSKGNPNWNVI
jgi:hypothetical protein